MDSKRDKVEDTASWMAGCRAEMPELSGDKYAHLWLNPASRVKHKDYTTKVSPSENIALSLRNRFFLERIRTFFASDPDAVLVNIGAGFSSYPFLLDGNRTYFEADCPDNISEKVRKIKELYADHLLPRRDIGFYPIDLCDQQDISSMFEDIGNFVRGKKSFILLEGLVYYLPPESTASLFCHAAAVQEFGSLLGVVSWDPGTLELPVYERFQRYMLIEGQTLPMFTCHNPHSIAELSGYRLKEQTGYVELSKEFRMPQPLKSSEDVFWERITILERIK